HNFRGNFQQIARTGMSKEAFVNIGDFCERRPMHVGESGSKTIKLIVVVGFD
ncbi:hypothetical protein LTR28_014115, partial [Elasticomyces elasticus]